MKEVEVIYAEDYQSLLVEGEYNAAKKILEVDGVISDIFFPFGMAELRMGNI